MKAILTTCALIGMTVGGLAQTAVPPPGSPEPPPATRDAANEPSQPNGLTEEQVTTRLEDMGYTNVEALELGGDGVWQARAEKDGASIEITLDGQGNVTEGAD